LAKPKVYVTRIIPDEALKKLNESLDVTVWNGELPPPREALLKSVRRVDGIILNVADNIDAEVIG
jgi:glyoxylate reductase